MRHCLDGDGRAIEMCCCRGYYYIIVCIYLHTVNSVFNRSGLRLEQNTLQLCSRIEITSSLGLWMRVCATFGLDAVEGGGGGGVYFILGHALCDSVCLCVCLYGRAQVVRQFQLRHFPCVTYYCYTVILHSHCIIIANAWLSERYDTRRKKRRSCLHTNDMYT